MNTKNKGNKAESVILSEFLKNNIPVLTPFGDNEKYDLVVDVDGKFCAVQVKYARFKNGVLSIDLRHRIGAKRIKYESYKNKVDFIAVWCEHLNTSYLFSMEFLGDKTCIQLRTEAPKNNSCITTVNWASDFEFLKVLNKYRGVEKLVISSAS